jgi:ferric-dicitrate binding protein FerR (iron transport regulator)
MNCRDDRKAWLRKGRGWWGAAALALVAGMAPLMPAQEGGQPARAVRLSYVDGTVSLTQGGQVIASQAVANTPLLEGMQLATAQDGRAEVQFEDGSVARIAPNSTLTLKVLRGQGASADAALELNRGLGYFELEGTDQIGQIRVLFGTSAATASGFTVMRVKMDAPPGELAVFSGNAHLGGSDGLALDLHGGESVALDADTPGNYNLADTIAPDSWDTWNSDRDQALNAESASQTGAQAELGGGDNSNPAWNDLDANGNWYDVPGQGYVWSPYDAANAGFDPYGVGNWMWMPGFGYTWVSGYSWGYLPFSCGAWNFYGGFGWGWAPGFGGCTPWWGIGFYPGAVIGIAPIGYRPPHRPIVPHPIHPGGPGFPGGRHLPMPMVPVNRRPLVLNAGLPARDRNTPVDIAGRAVVSLRPLPGREMPAHPGYARGAGFASQGFMGTPERGTEAARPGFAVTRPTYTPAPGEAAGRGNAAPYRGYIAPPVRTYSPPSRTYSPPARPYSTPAPRSSPAPRSAPAPAGGGGFHGGGGGGGGGAHVGGGGGVSRH